MSWVLSLPALLLLGWGMAGLIWWCVRSRAALEPLLPAASVGMGCVSLAMALLLATMPAPPAEQVVRAALLVEGAAGIWILRRPSAQRPRDGRR